MPLSLPRTFIEHPIRLAVIALACITLLLAACDSTDAAGGDDEPRATPSVTSTDVAPTGGSAGEAAGGAAGGGIEPANPEEPPQGILNSGAGSVPLGLGTYCWSPPTGGGRTAMCVDKLGIITAPDNLVVQPGEHLTVSGDEILMPPMSIGYAYLNPTSAEPIASGEDFRAWSSVSTEEWAIKFTDNQSGEDVLTLPDDLAPGRYILAVNYSAGPDRGSEATYGAILVVE
ncbi:MAG: hypothetical protein M0R73_05685 [Dehalococcoidia bacterium]|nr:hypothetical protein [Dehalococcoidia bacterium]